MVAEDLITALREGSKLVSNRDDDMYDRLSNRWSIGLIFMFAMIITSYSYIGDPIDCYEPQEFEDQWVEYMDNICWVANTYYVPMNESIPHPTEPVEYIQYYQWVPIILVFQALLFALPGMFWNAAAEGSGYSIKDIVKICKGTEALNPETRDASMTYLVNNMVRSMNYRKPYKTRKMPMGKRFGKYVFIMYLITKLLYIANAVIQLLLLSTILGDGYSTFGYDSLSNLLSGIDWHASPLFPRITLCSFEIRRMGQNIHRYTVQCLMSVNLFNEKVYMILWWWLIFVACMSILGLLLWVFTATTPSSQRQFTKKYLKIMKKNYRDDDVADFVDNFLRMDGVFSLRQIAKNTNDGIVGEVVAALWEKYLDGRKPRPLDDEHESLA